jgi:hypothetical protein
MFSKINVLNRPDGTNFISILHPALKRRAKIIPFLRNENKAFEVIAKVSGKAFPGNADLLIGPAKTSQSGDWRSQEQRTFNRFAITSVVSTLVFRIQPCFYLVRPRRGQM